MTSITRRALLALPFLAPLARLLGAKSEEPAPLWSAASMPASFPEAARNLVGMPSDATIFDDVSISDCFVDGDGWQNCDFPVGGVRPLGERMSFVPGVWTPRTDPGDTGATVYLGTRTRYGGTFDVRKNAEGFSQ
jgi:hypothetical protein